MAWYLTLVIVLGGFVKQKSSENFYLLQFPKMYSHHAKQRQKHAFSYVARPMEWQIWQCPDICPWLIAGFL